jgi:type IV secretory pathway VirJ component
VQRELGSAGYQAPILAGIGAGGTLAYAALAQSPAATVAGAVSVDPAPALHTTVPLCSGAPSHAAAGGGFRYDATDHLAGWWQLSASDAVAPPLRALATPEPADGPAAARLGALLRAAVAPAATPPDTDVAALPIVELRAATPGSIMAVFYSGDGGWRDLDKTIGEVLARDGMPVIGIDSLRYFWRAKTPDEIAADLARIVRKYASAWGTPHVALIGYSFGAGVVPFAYNRLPADVRERVVQVTLLGIEPRALFEFKVSGWLGAVPADAAPVLPEVQRFPPGLLQCVYGEAEPETLCRDPSLRGAEMIHTRGGHHFDGNYKALARAILDGARRRTAKR